MKSLLALSFLYFVQLVVSRCPSGTVQGVSDQDCYFYNAEPAMWLTAEDNCMRRKGHLASMSSSLTNSILRQAASLSCQKEFWIGASYDTVIPDQWGWADERRFSYQNWAAGQPTNQDNYCTALDVGSGGWYSRACNTAKPYVCRVLPAGAPAISTTATPRTKCPRGWTYVAGAEKCLRITESRDSWSTTWGTCKKLGGDLVSIADNATNYAIADFVFRQLSIGADDYKWIAIGIHKPTVIDPWQWTDGTPVTFTNWAANWVNDGSVVFMGVFGPKRGEYRQWNGRWNGEKTMDDANTWAICESKPM